MDIKAWLQNIASSFQPAYDKIKAWHLSPEVDSLLEEIWKQIPKAWQDMVYKELKKLYEEKGVEVAEKLLKKFIEWFNSLLKERNSD